MQATLPLIFIHTISHVRLLEQNYPQMAFQSCFPCEWPYRHRCTHYLKIRKREDILLEFNKINVNIRKSQLWKQGINFEKSSFINSNYSEALWLEATSMSSQSVRTSDITLSLQRVVTQWVFLTSTKSITSHKKRLQKRHGIVSISFGWVAL